MLESPETFIKKPTMLEDDSYTMNTSQVRKSEKLEKELKDLRDKKGQDPVVFTVPNRNES